MDFFSKIEGTIADKTRDITKKAKEFQAVSKLNMEIRSKEDFIKEQYMEIGKKYYELHKEETEPAMEEVFLIQQAKKQILQLQQTVADLKGQPKCSDCGYPLPENAAYCPGCGKQFRSFSKKV